MKRYLVLLLLTITAITGGACSSLGLGQAEPTALPFNRYTAQDVINAIGGAGLVIENVRRDMLIGRDAPSTFSDRYIFEIPRIAPSGGQILVFDSPENLAVWENYIDRLRASAETRRDVVYVYVHANVMLQVNANLTPAEADSFRTALLTMP